MPLKTDSRNRYISVSGVHFSCKHYQQKLCYLFKLILLERYDLYRQYYHKGTSKNPFERKRANCTNCFVKSPHLAPASFRSLSLHLAQLSHFIFSKRFLEVPISTTQDTSGGIHAAGGGKVYAWNLDVTTAGGSSAAIRSDRGGGTMVVDGGTYTTSGTEETATL